jgi:hypothetical protein
MRRFVLGCAAALVLLAALPAGSRAASCAQGKVVARNGTITLYRTHRGLMACAGQIHRRVAPWATDGFGWYWFPHFVSNGWFVGVDLVGGDKCGDFAVLAVDVRSGRRWALPAGTGQRDSAANGCVGTGTGALQAIAGLPDGTIAWINGPGDDPNAVSPAFSRGAYEVMLLEPGGHPRSIAFAPGVDPHVLSLDPTTLTWEQDGELHSLPLAA